VIWQTYQPGYRRSFYAGPCFLRSMFTAASGAIVLLSSFWCSLTGMSAMTGGGDIEDLDND
jgi:hypothetical protein